MLFENVRHRISSGGLPPRSTEGWCCTAQQSDRQDSNLRPHGPQPCALPTELRSKRGNDGLLGHYPEAVPSEPQSAAGL